MIVTCSIDEVSLYVSVKLFLKFSMTISVKLILLLVHFLISQLDKERTSPVQWLLIN